MSRRRGNKNIHIEYFRVYNDILKYEEVLDIELGTIFQTYLNTIAKMRKHFDFTKPPSQKELDRLREIVMDNLAELNTNGDTII